jgi:hypothetical protein
MKKTLLFLLMSFVLVFFFHNANAQTTNTVLINEFSNGDTLAQDWIELFVTADNTDLRGLYLTTFVKYGNRYAVSGTDSVKLSFGVQLSKTNTDLSNLKKGTFIVIYNAINKDPHLPADDLNVADSTLLFSSTNSTFTEPGSTWPGFTAYTGNATHNGICIYSSDPITTVLTGIFCVDYGATNVSSSTFNGGYGQAQLPSTTHFGADSAVYYNAGTTSGAKTASNWLMEINSNSTPLNYNSATNTLPIELLSFSASVTSGNSVKLNWKTATEVNNYGFDIERTSGSSGWTNIGFVAGSGNSNSPKEYYFTDNNPTGGSSLSYRLKQIDVDGSYQYYDPVTVSLAVSSDPQLLQNSPNPFNPSTTIKFYIPNTSDVSIKIYDIMGREVVTLINQQTTAGYHNVYWNGKNSRGENVASGVYLYRLTAGNFSETKKMNLLK